MKFNIDDVMLLKSTKFDWDISGKKGISYKARLLYEGDVFTAKTSKDFYERFALVAEEKGTASLKVKSYRVARDERVVEYCDLYIEDFKSNSKEAKY
jgi:hypothetical protein